MNHQSSNNSLSTKMIHIIDFHITKSDRSISMEFHIISICFRFGILISDIGGRQRSSRELFFCILFQPEHILFSDNDSFSGFHISIFSSGILHGNFQLRNLDPGKCLIKNIQSINIKGFRYRFNRNMNGFISYHIFQQKTFLFCLIFIAIIIRDCLFQTLRLYRRYNIQKFIYHIHRFINGIFSSRNFFDNFTSNEINLYLKTLTNILSVRYTIRIQDNIHIFISELRHQILRNNLRDNSFSTITVRSFISFFQFLFL